MQAMIRSLSTEFSEITFSGIHTVVLVGAGGTGARIAPVVAKLLRPDISLHIVDNDIVEERNIYRQHFVRRDIGRPKAEVVFARAAAAVALPNNVMNPNDTAPLVQLRYYTQTVQEYFESNSAYHHASTLYIGCVDNVKARQAIMDHICRRLGGVYIDLGNSMKYGQAIVSFKSHEGSYEGIRVHAPQLLQTDSGEESCAIRMDDQTVMANQMSATVGGALVASVLDGYPISQPFVEFSTQPPSVQGKGWDLNQVWDANRSHRAQVRHVHEAFSGGERIPATGNIHERFVQAVARAEQRMRRGEAP